MRVTYDRKIGEVGKCLLPSPRCQFTTRYVTTQDLCYLQIEQMRGMQRLTGFQESHLNVGRRGRFQQQLKDRRSVHNDQRLSRSSRIIWAGETSRRAGVRA